MYKDLKPDILPMDIRMTGMTGIEAAEDILKHDKNARMLFLTTFSDDEYIIKSLKIGDDIVSKIPSLISSSKADFKPFGITEKELSIITSVSDGMSNREIANKLYLSEGTVRNSITTILENLNLRDRTQLAIFYYRNR